MFSFSEVIICPQFVKTWLFFYGGHMVVLQKKASLSLKTKQKKLGYEKNIYFGNLESYKFCYSLVWTCMCHNIIL